jgi:hypothetical protein
MTIDPAMTVAEIIRRQPGAAAILARFGLDTCCGGSHPLEFACRAHRIDLAEVLRALERGDGAPAAAAACPACVTSIDAATAAPRVGGTPVSVELPGRSLRPVLTADMTLRDIIGRWPATAAVFGRHGLMGCGGAQGPVEPVGWFAKVHHVDVRTLMGEIEEAAARRTAGNGAAPGSTAADGAGTAIGISPADLARENLYRRFLKAALLFTFTGGATLGAWALAVMAMRGRLGGLGRGIIQVHGHYQLFGWVALFVVGIAYHILPRLTAVALPSYRLASWSFVLLTAGTALRSAQALDPSAARGALLIGGALLEVLGCGIFAWTLGRILALQRARVMPYQSCLAIGTAWLCASALLNLAHASWLAVTGGTEIPAWLNLPYLSVFLLGFVTFWILGVSLRTLPVFMGLRGRPRLAAVVAAPLALAIAILAVGEALYLRDGTAVARLAFGLGGLGTAIGLVLFTWALGVLSPFRDEAEPDADRGYEKFIILAYAWLVVSALMLGTFAVRVLAGTPMDHAYVGAYRHALTVGFITTMMAGMAMRIVPVFRGVPLWSPALRDATFWLLAVGNVIRVLFQSLSAAGGPAYLRIAGVSGVLEVTALLLFGINLWKTMDATTAEDTAAASWRPPIAPETKVGELLEAYPALLPVFMSSGFAPLANPVMRRTVARSVSIAHACRMHGIELESFLGRLRAVQAGPAA